MSEHIHAFLSEWTAAEPPVTPRRWRPSSPTTSPVSAHSDSSSPGPHGWTAIAKAWPMSSSVSKRSRSASTATLLLSRPAITPAARYQGQPLPEALRATLVIVSDSEALRLAAVHMSFIAGTPGSPAMPGPTGSAESSADTNADREGR